MIIILKQDAPEAQVQAFCRELTGMGFERSTTRKGATPIFWA